MHKLAVIDAGASEVVLCADVVACAVVVVAGAIVACCPVFDIVAVAVLWGLRLRLR